MGETITLITSRLMMLLRRNEHGTSSTARDNRLVLDTTRANAALLACLLITSCGKGILKPLPQPNTTPITGFSNLLAIGNSITLHLPNAPLGWSGDWGMAASAITNDYTQRTGSYLALPVARVGASDMETDPTALTSVLDAAVPSLTPQTAVVVELGDNVPGSGAGRAKFSTAYSQLLDVVSKGKTLTCTGTFWWSGDLDDLMKKACLAHGGQFIFIGDIYIDPRNTDYNPISFSNYSVQRHPHDWSHNQIAIRVQQSIRDQAAASH